VRLHRIEERQFLPDLTLKEAWDFFADPRNLQLITPPALRLELTSEPPPRIYPGLLITYRLEPFPRVRASWVTEITHLVEGRLFVDEQRIGPYRLWHHEHHFAERDGGVEVRDLVQYAMPFGLAGDAVQALVVRRQLSRVFAFRRRVLAVRFGAISVDAVRPAR
jgi:ligand-binding SRPBCC domain-containing protein